MRRKQALSQLLLVAQDCLEKKQAQNSIKILHQVLEVEPKNSQAFRLLGDCFEQLGQIEEAQKNYKIGIDCNPLSTICYVNYGLLLYNSGRKEQAEKIYELCMNIDCKDKTLLNNFSILLFEMGKMQKAEGMIKKCLQVDPNNENCKKYLEQVKKSKIREGFDGNKKATADDNENQLLQLLFERDLKLAQKQTQIEKLQKELLKRQKEINRLKNEVERFKREKCDQDSMKLCKICLSKPAMYANRKCGHLCSCKNCLKIVGKNCPICRQTGSFLRVYSSLIKHQAE